MLEVFEPRAPNYFTFFRPIPLTLSVSRNPILTHILIAPTPGLAFSLVMPRTPAAASLLSSGRVYLSLNFLPLLFLRLNPTLLMYGSTSFLTTPPRCHFLMCMLPLLAFLLRKAEPTPFLRPFFPFAEISSFWGTSIAINSSGTQELLSTPLGRKYVTESSLLTSSPSMILTYPPFYVAPLAVAPPLTSSLLLPLLPFLALGRYFGTWVLITYQFFYPPLSLRSFAPTNVPLPSIFKKLAGMTLLLTLTLTVLWQRNTRLFFFPLLLLSLPFWY